MNLCIRENRLLWKNSYTELISGAEDVGDEVRRWVVVPASLPELTARLAGAELAFSEYLEIC